MEKRSVEEMSDELVGTTIGYTRVYFQHHKNKPIDRAYWGAIAIGYMGAMLALGYSSEEAEETIKRANEKLPPPDMYGSPYAKPE